MKKYAVIVAGGSGLRMGTPTPKQFLQLQGKPVLWYTLTVFLRSFEDMQVILVVPDGHVEVAKELVAMLDGVGKAGGAERVRLVTGGETRFHSVRKGLELVEEEAVVFVHDGVRCLVTPELVRSCYEQAARVGSAIPVVDCKDSVRLVRVGDATQSEVIDRSRVKLVQTPQTFLSSILLSAYQAEYRDSFTDEATVVEASGRQVCLIEGEVSNIKITTPVDLVIAEKILEVRQNAGAIGAGD